MNFVEKVKANMHNDLTTFKWFERTIATTCIAIPIVLRLTDKDAEGKYNDSFRPCISDYVYMYHNYVFGMMLTIAAMLFIFNGAVYFKNEDKSELELSKNGKWYNVVLGLSLLCVICLPYQQYNTAHDIFAGIFFLGNALVTGLFHKKKNRVISIILAVLTAAFIIIGFCGIIPKFTLLWGEWFSLTVIAIHFILQAMGNSKMNGANATEAK